ncbi:MAG: hypothetical protein GXO36_00150 [Chloroflexi bacterium]|nr:hypothetical protein [Chloroflexota bacterium]
MPNERVQATYVFPQGFGWGVALKAPADRAPDFSPSWLETLPYRDWVIVLDWARLMPEPTREDEAQWAALESWLRALMPRPLWLVLADPDHLPPWWNDIPEFGRAREAARWAARVAERLHPYASRWVTWLRVPVHDVPPNPPRPRQKPAPRWEQHQAMVQALRAVTRGQPIGVGLWADAPLPRPRGAPVQRRVPPTLAEFFLLQPAAPLTPDEIYHLMRGFALWDTEFWLFDPGPKAGLQAADLARRVYQIWRAVNFNIPALGYFAWPWSPSYALSPTDVALYRETEDGFQATPAGAWLASTARDNAIKPQDVATYAAEAWSDLYPAEGLDALRARSA